MINIEERCKVIPREYETATPEERVNLRLEVMQYLDYDRASALTCWETLGEYDRPRISITNPKTNPELA